MESAPQSTITHIAVIELASDPGVPHACRRGRGGRIKRRPALPKRAALNRRDHAKITPPAQRRGGQKPSISEGISRRLRLFARKPENPRNGCRRGAAALSPCPRRPKSSELTTPRQPFLLKSQQPRLDLLLARMPQNYLPGSCIKSRNRHRRKRSCRSRRCRAP